MKEFQDQLIFSFPRAEGEAVHFTAKKFKDRFYFDVRVWFYDAEHKTMRPTRKGICFQREHLTQITEGIDALKKLAEKSIS